MAHKRIEIILVNDSAETQDEIQGLLATEADFEVVASFRSRQECFEQTTALRPHIILMDVDSVADSLEASTRNSEDVFSPRIIMMSNQNTPNLMQAMMLAGGRFFLSKPVDRDQLHNTIRSLNMQN